jgi:hypothetical protein
MNPDLTERCFVVLRTDADGSVTVKLIVWSQEAAEEQVGRLNKLNAHLACRYHWVFSRALRR